MKRLILSMVIAIALLGTVGACSSQSGGKEKGQVAQKNVVLDKEMIHLFEKGQIKGIPFQAGKKLTMADVEKKWGKPAKVVDNEDIHDYVYHKDGHDIVFDEDETRIVYLFKVSYNINRTDISNAMGKPDKGRMKTGHVLIYSKGDYNVQFERLNENKWWIILFKKN